MHIFIRYDGDRETADLLDNRIFAALKGKPPFLKCVGSIWALPK